MISVQEAKNLILQHVPKSRKIWLPLHKAAFHTLAAPVYARVDTPPFHQSSVDGYAFRFSDWNLQNSLPVYAQIQAGKFATEALPPLHCARIFTGAPLPTGADTVVMQEHITKENESIKIQNLELRQAANVRPKGAQTQKGALALSEEQILNPAALSYLAGLGIFEVCVYDMPTVKLIITGNELAEIQNELQDAQVYESNSYPIAALLQQWGARLLKTERVLDDYESTYQTIKENLDADILILTGGVSVGDFDYVSDALAQAGVQKIFHKVKQKPGKPLFVGCTDTNLVFGLPGNPASVLTCVYEYLSLAVGAFAHKNYYHTQTVLLKHDFKKKAGLTHFFKGFLENNQVQILPNQESYLMNSFAVANCLVHLPEAQEHFCAGQEICVTIL